MTAWLLAALVLAQGTPPTASPSAAPDEAAGPGVTLTTELSQETLHLGDKVELIVTATHPQTVRLFFPEAPDIHPFRALGRARGPERVVQDDQVVATWRMTVSPLRLGRRKVPPFPIDYEDADAQTGEVLTPAVAANVEPRLDLSSDEIPLKGNLPAMQLFDTNWLLILLLIGAGVVAVTSVVTWLAVRYVSGLPRRGPPPPPPVPAHHVARERIEALQQRQLLAKGELREFVFEVSEILREYLGLRVGLDTLEMTTSELLRSMKLADPRGLSIYVLEDFLQTTDFVKFANQTPTHRTCEQALEQLEDIVAKTRHTDEEVHSLLSAHDAKIKRDAPASWKRRVLAHGVDLTLQVAICGGMAWWLVQQEWSSLGVGVVSGALWGVVTFARDLWWRRGPKRLVGLTIVPAQLAAGEAPVARVEAGALLVRNLPLIVPVIGHTVELVVMLYAADGRRIGDRMANTRIVEGRITARGGA